MPSSSPGGAHLRVGVLVVAYNASSTLASTLGRLPSSFVETLDHVIICDDASVDDTYEIGVSFSQTSLLSVGRGLARENCVFQFRVHGSGVVVLLRPLRPLSEMLGD